MKRTIAFVLIFLTGCTSSFDSKIVAGLRETTDTASAARQEALFYKLYPNDTAKDKAIAICKNIKSGLDPDKILSEELEKSRSLHAEGKITVEESADITVIETVIMLEAKKGCTNP